MKLARYVKFREEQFGGVLFETQSEKVYTLNATAAAIVRELQSGCDIADISARLQDRFQSTPATIEQDVLTLVGELRQKGLVGESRE
jgi:hypothetical protein